MVTNGLHKNMIFTSYCSLSKLHTQKKIIFHHRFIPKHTALQRMVSSPSCTHYTWYATKAHSGLSEYDMQCSIDKRCYIRLFQQNTNTAHAAITVSEVPHWSLSTKYCYGNSETSRPALEKNELINKPKVSKPKFSIVPKVKWKAEQRGMLKCAVLNHIKIYLHR